MCDFSPALMVLRASESVDPASDVVLSTGGPVDVVNACEICKRIKDRQVSVSEYRKHTEEPPQEHDMLTNACLAVIAKHAFHRLR